ncbi:MAG: hypothetical protein H0U55_07830, partial [Rubrobacteraceae bacterium]|nr:hypothetical protein [Rubrobacteraceae bacterium]
MAGLGLYEEYLRDKAKAVTAAPEPDEATLADQQQAEARRRLKAATVPRARILGSTDTEGLRPMGATQDVTARPPRPLTTAQAFSQLPQPTISGIRRHLIGGPIAPVPNLETPKFIGQEGYQLQDIASDALQAKGPLGHDTMAGAALDFTPIPGAMRGAFQGGQMAGSGHPFMGAAVAALGAVPVVGGEAGALARTAAEAALAKNVPRILKDVPFSAYSRLEAAVVKAPFEKGTAEQWAAALNQNVAAGERQYRGVNDFLAQRAGQPIEKQQILAHLDANPINIRRTQYGGIKPREAVMDAPTPALDWQLIDGPDGFRTGAQFAGHPMAPYHISRDPELAAHSGYAGTPWAISPPDDSMTFHATEAEARSVAQQHYNENYHTMPQTGLPGLPKGYHVIPPVGTGVNGWGMSDANGHIVAIDQYPSREAAIDAARQNARASGHPSPAYPLPKGYTLEGPVYNTTEGVNGRWHIGGPDGQVVPGSSSTNPEEATTRAHEHATANRSTGSTEHKPFPLFAKPRYNEPGGTNYGEALLRLERNPITDLPEGHTVVPKLLDQIDVGLKKMPDRGTPTSYHVLDPSGVPVPNTGASTEDAARQAGLRSLAPRPFVNPFHFPDENSLVHTRWDDRVINGEKVRFFEEMQSDWHQKMRQWETWHKKTNALQKEIEELGQPPIDPLGHTSGRSTESNTYWEK